MKEKGDGLNTYIKNLISNWDLDKFPKIELLSIEEAEKERKQIVEIYNSVIDKYTKIKDKLKVTENDFFISRFGKTISWSFNISNQYCPK